MSADADVTQVRDTASDQAVRAVVFTSPAHEFVRGRGTFAPTTSTLFVGRSEAVLVDAQYIDSDITALGDLIEQTGRQLTTIYVTHGHADHYFGIGELLERFPDARPLATAGVVEYIENARTLQTGQWTAMFGDAAVKPTVLPETLHGDAIDLEGTELRVIEIGQGDILPSTVVHAPSIDTVVAGDVIYNQIHAMLAFAGPDGWASWIESIDRVEQLGARTIVAGHKQPEASDELVASMIQGTRSYIADFANAAQTASDAAELVELMLAKYGRLGNLWTLKFSAHAWFARDRG
jgi:glyoxylase-like metal-dependent hydrolase (beta-lactamase superfamily II)